MCTFDFNCLYLIEYNNCRTMSCMALPCMAVEIRLKQGGLHSSKKWRLYCKKPQKLDNDYYKCVFNQERC